MDAVRIAIDRSRCIGSGQCVRTDPDVFTQDDEGLSTLLPGAASRADPELAREAARTCPVAAIAVRAVPKL
ncbi:ferredoxin [Streptomyces sp. NPDC012888]|uniref:ferredoxin n=1 Tax=Streptomyces sp. NPDC012888 TaxID=3364855 RepID=UPI0036963B43